MQGGLVGFKSFNPVPSQSVGNGDSLMLFRDLTGEHLSSDQELLHVEGWAFSSNAPVSLLVRKADGNLGDATIKTEASPDVYQFFHSRGRDIPHAREARFDITTSYGIGDYLHITADNRILGRLPLDGTLKSLQSSELQLNIDYIGYKSDFMPRRAKLDFIKISVLDIIGKSYQSVISVLAGISLIFYLIFTIQVFRFRANFIIWVIITSLLIAIITRLIILSIIEISSFPGINTSYLAPAYPLVLLFIMIVLAGSYDNIKKKRGI